MHQVHDHVPRIASMDVDGRAINTSGGRGRIATSNGKSMDQRERETVAWTCIPHGRGNVAEERDAT